MAADYASYHAHPKNRLCHGIGIPLIMLCVVRWTQWPRITIVPGAAILLPVYLAWSVPVAACMAVLVLAMAVLAPHLSGWMVWAAFAAGWIFQILGHAVFEGRSPAFAKNIRHFLVGPAWIVAEILGLKMPSGGG